MTGAILKFQESHPPKLDSSILLAAIDTFPQLIAIAQSGKVIFSNQSFSQLTIAGGATSACIQPPELLSINFSAGGHDFSLMVPRNVSREARDPEMEHFAMMGRLTGGVAHDFNNLLTGILLYCDLLQSKVESNDRLWHKVAEIRKAAEQGASLVRQLMTVGREESLAPAAVCFGQVVRDMTPLLRRLLGENIRINADLEEGSAFIGISLAQAQQIVLNLALNARDAMPRGGGLLLETRFQKIEATGKRTFEFAVADSGVGMDAQTASRMFDPFFTTKPAGKGTGMGLATVRKIVEDAGGAISVDTTPGRGTRITIRLPEVLRDKHGPQSVQVPVLHEEHDSSPRGVRL
jgi:signal transduction histidine kinase